MNFLLKLLNPLLKTGLPLMENVLQPLAKMVLIPLGLTTAASAAHAGMRTKISGLGTTALKILNEDMEHCTKIEVFH